MIKRKLRSRVVSIQAPITWSTHTWRHDVTATDEGGACVQYWQTLDGEVNVQRWGSKRVIRHDTRDAQTCAHSNSHIDDTARICLAKTSQSCQENNKNLRGFDTETVQVMCSSLKQALIMTSHSTKLSEWRHVVFLSRSCARNYPP